MSELENLKEERSKIGDQIKKIWFKMKLKEDDGKVPTWFFDAYKSPKLHRACPELIEEHIELSEQIAELEMQEMQRKIAEIWDSTD